MDGLCNPPSSNQSYAGLNPTLWPKGSSADDLLQQVDKQKKEKGVKDPFPYADLRNFLPNCCAGGRKHDDSDHEDEPCQAAKELAKAFGVTKKKKPRLSLLQWTAAYDRYALAAAACGVWDLASALEHKDLCLQVTEEGRSKGMMGAVVLLRRNGPTPVERVRLQWR